MSNFYNQASWVLVPSGIEEDIVFAQKPISGLGDLSFTRASDATYTDASGVVRRSPYNLLQQSNTFNVTWGTAFATVSIGQTGYDGTNNAWLFSKSFSDGRTSQNITLTSGAYTYSVYAKAGTKNWVFLRVDGTSNRTAYFNLQTGVTGTASGCTSSISSVGNGWYRCSITFTDLITVARIYVADANNDTSGTSGNILIQAAQLVEGTSALDYFPTTNRQDVPRIDFRNADGTLSSCGRLLLEPQRTNSIRNSSMMGAVAGSPGTLPTNYTLNTNAGLTQTVVGVGTDSGLPYVDLRFNGTSIGTFIDIRYEANTAIAAATGQTWAFTNYVKRISGTYNSANMVIVERTAPGATVTSGSQAVTITSSLQRFSFVRTLSGGATVGAVQPLLQFILSIGQTYDFTIRIAAPQMELGAYATTWVPTTTAAVTRLADAARTAVGATSLFASQWTAFGELVIPSRGTTGTGVGYGFRSVYGSTSLANWPFYIIHGTTTGTIDFQWTVGGSIAKTVTIAITYGTRFKFAATSDGTLYINGSLSSASSSLTPSTPVEFGFGRLGQSDFSAGESVAHAEANLYTSRLSNAELAQRTTL